MAILTESNIRLTGFDNGVGTRSPCAKRPYVENVTLRQRLQIIAGVNDRSAWLIAITTSVPSAKGINRNVSVTLFPLPGINPLSGNLRVTLQTARNYFASAERIAERYQQGEQNATRRYYKQHCGRSATKRRVSLKRRFVKWA